MNPLFVLYFVCSTFYFVIGLITFLSNKKKMSNKMFLIVCFNLSTWALLVALMCETSIVEIATMYRRLAVISWSTIYFEILYYIIFLTNSKSLVNRWWKNCLLFIPAVVSINLYFFDPVTSKDIVKIPYGWAFLNPQDKGLLWDQFFNVYYITYMAVAMVLILLWYKRTIIVRERIQARIVGLSFISIFILASITDIVFPMFELTVMPPLAVLLIVGCISGLCYAMLKYSMMTITAESVMLNLYRIMDEGLVILDENNLIIRVNKGAQKILSCTEEDMIGKGFYQLDKGVNPCEDVNFVSQEVMLMTEDGEGVQVLMSCSLLQDKFQDKLGTVYAFQDIRAMKAIEGELVVARDFLEEKVMERTNELNSLNLELKLEIEDREKREKIIEDLAFRDQLTCLPNRRYFFDQLSRDINKANKEKKYFVVLFLDLDGFKMINDSLGHDLGDKLLIRVARLLENSLRETDLIARVGGDEFLVLLHHPCDKRSIIHTCDTIIKAINKPIELSGNEVHISTSIGVAVYPNDGNTADAIIKNADIAMYRAKDAGKGRYVFFDDQMRENIDEIMKLTNDLYKAVENNELLAVYQPQISAKAHKIMGFEALIRWEHPEKGLLSPEKFIGLAERTGLIIPIGEWIFREAVNQLKLWQKNLDSELTMAINLSVRQLQHPSLYHMIASVLEEADIDSRHIELEITENILVENPEFVIEKIRKIKELGVKFAIDDFGTEYSSLSYLRMLPIDRIKIAKTFVDGIGIRERDESIIASVIILGKKLKMRVIAEGVEKKNQLSYLTEQECDDIQGFYFYKPKLKDEIEGLYKRNSYDGEYIVIYDERSNCSLNRCCSKRLPNVFTGEDEEWIKPDAEDIESIIETIEACPTGALSYKRLLE